MSDRTAVIEECIAALHAEIGSVKEADNLRFVAGLKCAVEALRRLPESRPTVDACPTCGLPVESAKPTLWHVQDDGSHATADPIANLTLIERLRVEASHPWQDNAPLALLLNQAADALTAESRPTPGSEWRPMDTCDDGALVLMLTKHGAIEGYWNKVEETGHAYFWQYIGDFYSQGWMPVPAAPASVGAGTPPMKVDDYYTDADVTRIVEALTIGNATMTEQDEAARMIARWYHQPAAPVPPRGAEPQEDAPRGDALSEALRSGWKHGEAAAETNRSIRVAQAASVSALVERLRTLHTELEDNRVHGDHDPAFLTDVELGLTDAIAALEHAGPTPRPWRPEDSE